MNADKQTHFSSSETLSAKEEKCNEVLQKCKDKLCYADGTYDVIARDFFENRPFVESSKLMDVLKEMPKGAIHHMHTTASPPTQTYIDMTYDNKTYYNNRLNIFKCFPKPEQVQDGYIRCTDYRRYSSDP